MRSQVRHSSATCKALRRFVARLSSKRRAITANVAALNTASAASAARQSIHWVSSPPKGALRQAITPRPVKACDITRAPSVGAWRSRTTARAVITAAPMAAPCSMRPSTSQPRLGARVQATAAST